MLGINKNSHRWRWAAAGKHPAAADYIQPSGASPLVEALSNWITKGYQSLLENGPSPERHHSWRFWLRGGDGKTVICGLICDSSDRIGRPFPFAMMGEGRFKGLEKQWPRLCIGFEQTWSDLEYLASHHYENTRSLVDALVRICPPEFETLAPPTGSGGSPAAGTSPDCGVPSEFGRDEGRLVFGIGQQQGDPIVQAVAIMEQQAIRQPEQLPLAAFMGGTLQQAYLALVLHPLTNADFIALWRL